MAGTVDAARVYEIVDIPEDLDEKIRMLAALVRESRYTVFVTGAGVSTSAGIPDYRGPSGCWTMERVRELESRGAAVTADEVAELDLLRQEQAREVQKSGQAHDARLPKEYAEPAMSHMAIATLVHRGVAHYCVTTNLDGLFRKAGLVPHAELCCLHGDDFVERCSGCGFEFERNYKVRARGRHVHDHRVGTCDRCGSAAPGEWTGRPKGEVEKLRTVTAATRPEPSQVSVAGLNAKARGKWPNATLVSLNGEALEFEGDALLRAAVARAALPLSFTFRISRSGGAKTGGFEGFESTHLVGVRDAGVGTRDSHINFGEQLDPGDWDEAEEHCGRADLCIVLGTSMTLRHTAHFPFMAARTVIVNLQPTPDDHRCFRGLRIWGTCDDVLGRLLVELGLAPDPVPAWRPRDALSEPEMRARGLPQRALRLARHLEATARRHEAGQGAEGPARDG